MGTRKIVLQQEDGTFTTFVQSPEKRLFGRVKDWWEVKGENIFDYNDHGPNIKFMVAVQATPAYATQRGVRVTKAISDWMVKINMEWLPAGVDEEIVRTFLHKALEGNIAITNKKGYGKKYGNRRSYLLPDANDGTETEDAEMLPIMFVGTTVEIIGREWMPGIKNNDCYQIRAWNASRPETFVNKPYSGNEGLFHVCSTIARVPGLPHDQRLGPFPQAGLPVNRDPNGLYSQVLVPIMGNEDTNGIDGGEYCKMHMPADWIEKQPIGTKAPVYPYGMP